MPDPIIPPPGLSGRHGPVVPVLARRGEFLPTVGGFLVISLPGEDVRATVVEIKSRDVLIVQLTGQVGAVRGGHSYKRDDMVAVQRGEADGRLQERWIPIDERAVRMKEDAERLAAAAVLKTEPPLEPGAKRRGRPKKGAA